MRERETLIAILRGTITQKKKCCTIPKKYPQEFKKQIVVSCQNGTSIQELCQKHRIAQSTLYRWLREYGDDAEGHMLTDYNTLKKETTRIVHILQMRPWHSRAG